MSPQRCAYPRACPCLAIYAAALLLLLLAVVAPNSRRGPATPGDQGASHPPPPAHHHHQSHFEQQKQQQPPSSRSTLDVRSSADSVDYIGGLDGSDEFDTGDAVDPRDPTEPRVGPATPGPPRYSVPLDAGGRALLEWTVGPVGPVGPAGRGHDRGLTLRVTVTPWRYGLLLGFSDRGRFEDAEFAVWWGGGGGRHGSFACAWSDARGLLVPRRSAQPCGFHLLRSPPNSPESREGGARSHNNRPPGRVTGRAVTVTRVLDTCEPRDYRVQDGTVHVLYALLDEPIARSPWGTLNVTSLRDRGVRLVRLLRGGASSPPPPPSSEPRPPSSEPRPPGSEPRPPGTADPPPAVFEVRAPNVTVPALETTYWCHVTEFPHGSSKQHIVKFEPLVTRGHEAMVHHMEVFQCPVSGALAGAYSGPCDDPRRPVGLDSCRRVLAAWAMGAEPFSYPDEAGLPIGGPGSSPLLRLEVHYHNPGLLAGRVDSSGLRLHFTPRLRPQDAAVMELGLAYSARMAVPPGQRRFQLTGYCPPACTRQALPRSGLRVFASQLHTHTAGVSVSTWLLRNGTGAPRVLNADPHYSASLQEIRPLTPPLLVMPGDLLVTTCSYNTEERSAVTVGGLSIEQEMCVNYIHYYPRTGLELCKSDVSDRALARFFSFLEGRGRGRPCAGDAAASAARRYARVSWDDASALLLASLYAQAPIDLHCNTSARQRIPGPWREQPLPEWTPPPEPPRDCPAAGLNAATTPASTPCGS